MKTWEEAFVAVSAALDGTVEEAVHALGDAGMLRASDLVRGLRGEAKATRAYALATALADVATELVRMELR
jgi:hypothetical protein